MVQTGPEWALRAHCRDLPGIASISSNSPAVIPRLICARAAVSETSTISSDAWLNSKTPTARAAMARTRLAPALPTQSQSDLRVFCARPKQTPQERQSDLKFLALKCGGCWCFTPRRGSISPDGVDMNDKVW